MFLPSLFMPSPSVGFQFLLPIKPLSIKLPFGQRSRSRSLAGSFRTAKRGRMSQSDDE